MTIFAEANVDVDLRMLRSFRVLRPLKLVSRIPSKHHQGSNNQSKKKRALKPHPSRIFFFFKSTKKHLFFLISKLFQLINQISINFLNRILQAKTSRVLAYICQLPKYWNYNQLYLIMCQILGFAGHRQIFCENKIMLYINN